MLAIPEGWDDLLILNQMIREEGLKYFVLGAGSNLLVADQGFDGLVIKTSKLNKEIREDESKKELYVGSSVLVSMLLGQASRKGWGGLHFLTGVPGTVGGTIFMNAGTHIAEVKDRVLRIEYFPLEAQDSIASPLVFEKPDLKYSYRKNHFLPKDAIVYSATWSYDPSEPVLVKKEIDELLVRRKSTQPIDLPSCGSVFKNPRDHGLHSWQVIEKLGLRGHRIGNACFSDKHSNFIVNLGGATAQDVKSLIDLAKARAHSELGIHLEEEVRYLGFS